jgi:hypothetical protein
MQKLNQEKEAAVAEQDFEKALEPNSKPETFWYLFYELHAYYTDYNYNLLLLEYINEYADAKIELDLTGDYRITCDKSFVIEGYYVSEDNKRNKISLLLNKPQSKIQQGGYVPIVTEILGFGIVALIIVFIYASSMTIYLMWYNRKHPQDQYELTGWLTWITRVKKKINNIPDNNQELITT